MHREIANMTLPLFVPADRADRFAKAASAGPDAVIIDLEDAVAPQAKQQAREQLPEGLSFVPPDMPVLLRINAAGTEWHEADMAAAADDWAGAQGAERQSAEIGGGDQPDQDRVAARPLEPQADQRRQEAAARHHHEDGEQQAANGSEGGEHRLGAGAARQAARRPSAPPASSSTNVRCSARTAASKSRLSTMNWTSTLRI